MAQDKQSGENIYVFGSADLTAGPLRHGLVDEYRICLALVVLGRGNPLLRKHGIHRFPCSGRVLLVAASAFVFISADQARAQPPPTFSATCEDVREKADALDSSSDELITIEVTGELLLAEFDGALSYMGLCSEPAPNVLCITYRLNNYKVGDPVTVAGAYQRSDRDFITLDPCLHYPPEQRQ